MRKLNRLLLINWLNYSFELIDFGRITFLTGKNASGKSTIIDAMQLVMLGDASGSFFNKAANEKSGRTLESYLYGYVPSDGSQNYRPLRTSAFTSYVALEFVEETTGRLFTLGFVADCPKESKSRFKYRWFILRQSGIPSDNFLNNSNIPLSISELRQMLRARFDCGRNNQYEIFDSGRDFREEELLAFGNLSARYHRILRKAVSFTPITNITNFISEYICAVQNEIDISAMQDSIRNYTSLEETAKIIEERISSLSLIAEQYRRFSDMKSKQKLYDYFLKRVILEEERSKLQERKARLTLSTSKVEEINKAKTKLDEEIENIEKRRNELLKEMFTSSEAKRKEELVHAIKSLEDTRDSLHRDATLMCKDICNLTAEYRESVKRVKELIKDEDIPGEDIMVSVSDVDVSRLSQLDYHALCKAVTAMKNWFQERDNAIRQDLSAKKTMELQLEKEISNLGKGIKSYPQAILRFREDCEKAFSRNVDILADLLEVTDMNYQNAIESYLGNKRFFLVLNENEREEARKILEERYIGTNAGFITPNDINWNAEKNSLYSLITAENETVLSYASSIFCKLAETGCPSLRDDGLLVLNEDTSALREEKSLFLGQRSIQEMLKRKQREFEILENEIAELSLMEREYRCGATCPTFDAYKASDYAAKAEKIGRLKKIEEEIREKKVELQSLDLFVLDELQRKITDCENEKKTKEIKKEDLIKQNGEYSRDIEILNCEIPACMDKISTLEAALKEECPDDNAEDEFRKSYSANANKENLVSLYSAQQKRFTTASDNLKTVLVSQRETYNRIYHAGMNIIADDNAEYDKELSALSESKLPEYMEKIKEAKESAYKQFKNDFLNKMSDNIKSSELQIRRFNTVLSKYHFGEDSYEFSVQAAKGYEQYYRMFTSEELTAGTDSLFSQLFLERYQKELDELFEILLPSQSHENDAEKQKAIQKHIDYKTYLAFDLKVKGNAGSQNLSETIIVKSGGEVQIPFYISVLASFAQICRISDEKHNNTVRLVIFDEAFSKMDGERIRECLRLLDDFDLQVIFSAPPEKTMDAVSFADRIIVAYKEDLSSYTRSFTSGELKNENTI